MLIDTAQLLSGRTILTIYNLRGQRLSDTASTAEKREEASYGVHKNNLYASKQLANADYERVLNNILNHINR